LTWWNPTAMKAATATPTLTASLATSHGERPMASRRNVGRRGVRGGEMVMGMPFT